jgi:hypothetical protein
MVASDSCLVMLRSCRNQRATPGRVNADTFITRTVAMDSIAASGMYGRQIPNWQTAAAAAGAMGGE